MWGGSNGGNIFANTVVCKARSEIPVDVTLGNIFNIRGAIHDGHRVEAGDSFTGWRGRCWQPSSYLYSWEVEALVADIYSNTWYIYIIYIYIIYIHMYICISAFATSDNWTPRVWFITNAVNPYLRLFIFSGNTNLEVSNDAEFHWNPQRLSNFSTSG